MGSGVDEAVDDFAIEFIASLDIVFVDFECFSVGRVEVGVFVFQAQMITLGKGLGVQAKAEQRLGFAGNGRGCDGRSLTLMESTSAF